MFPGYRRAAVFNAAELAKVSLGSVSVLFLQEKIKDIIIIAGHAVVLLGGHNLHLGGARGWPSHA
jgi:hypothetical protein